MFSFEPPKKEIKSPSKKQIKFANAIAERLNLDFPKSDADFTAKRYFDFISENIKNYNKAKQTDEELMAANFGDCGDDFWGYTEGFWEY